MISKKTEECHKGLCFINILDLASPQEGYPLGQCFGLFCQLRIA